MNETQILYLIAGEPSGDLLGAHLMAALKRQSPTPIKFYGIGGERMASEGLASLFPYQELTHLGIVEILPHALELIARMQTVMDDIKAKNPAALITIDVPGFCKHVVKKLRKDEFSTHYIHYVAPSVWAWKPKRAELFAKLFDHLLALLPFEPPYFQRVGLNCTFVGHPVVAETKTGNAESFRKRYDIAADVPLFCVLPGSRKGEIKRLMPIFARAIALLAEPFPQLAIAVAVPKALLDSIAPYFEGCPFRAIITAEEDDKKDAIAGSDCAIAKSGTVTLEVAMAHTPMVVAYRVNSLSAFIYKHVRLIKWVTLVNILLGREAVPELLQEACTPIMIASAAASLMGSQALRDAQKQATTEALSRLIPSGSLPSDKAASTILALLK